MKYEDAKNLTNDVMLVAEDGEEVPSQILGLQL